MNQEVMEFLASNYDKVLENQKRRRAIREIGIKRLVERAEQNASKLNYEIFNAIMKTYIEAKRDEALGLKIDNAYKFYSVNIKTSDINGITERELGLAREFNSGNDDKKIVYSFIDGKNEPVLLDIKEYQDKIGLSFSLEEDNKINPMTFQELEELVNKFIFDELKNCKVIDDNIIKLVAHVTTTLANRDLILEEFNKRIEESYDVFSLYLVKDINKYYDENRFTENHYYRHIDYIDEYIDVVETYGQKEADRLKEYYMCQLDRTYYNEICYIGYFNNGEPLLLSKRKLMRLLAELHLEGSRQDDKMLIESTALSYEDLVKDTRNRLIKQ